MALPAASEMRFPAVLSSVLAIAAVCAMAGAQFRTGVETVAVHVTVTDQQGRLVPDLGVEAFRVLDNGRPVEVTTFSNEPQPITVALMLDMSESIQRRFARVRESTFHFINGLRAGDRAAIGSFGHEIAISPMVTGDKAVLLRVAEEELWPGGGTPLWNAIGVAMTALAGEPGRRVVLVLTDGADTGNLPGHRTGYGQVARQARDDGFMIYAIGMEETGINARLRELADQTGGGRFELRRDADLSDTFTRVTDELRTQYVLGFTPVARDGRRHRLDVQLSNPTLRARARRSYLAPRGGSR